jgi:peptidoglycan/xylan/chitin deacetylase (PgdA/CDA1 family)
VKLFSIAALAIVLLAGCVTFSRVAVSVAERAAPDVLYRVDTRRPIVALTIDDGPSAATPEILRVLAQHDAHATFFVIGSHVRAQTAIVGAIRQRGHELAHHMMYDQPSIQLAPTAFRAEFLEMDSVLRQHGGSRYFRPGSGWFNERMTRDARGFGYRLVLGSVYPFDAQLPLPDMAARYVLANTRPGSIIILHDGPQRGPRTVQALSQILPRLRERGFQVVTLTELLESARLERVAARR